MRNSPPESPVSSITERLSALHPQAPLSQLFESKRTRSGRSDSNSCDSGACGCNADSRSVIEETGDSGGELRMDAAVPRACDYGMHAAVPWQYRAEAPGLLGQRLTRRPYRSIRELPDSLADRLAPARRRLSQLAR